MSLHFYQTQSPLYKQSSSEKELSLDAVLNNDNYQIIIDIPGIAEDKITIEVQKDILTIKVTENETVEELSYLIKERPHNGISRKLHLPKDADNEKLSAHLDLGVLTITIPRKEEEKPRAIKIQSA